jgi:hypothetical protein
MTPHRHWFKDYKPCQTPVRFANGEIVRAAGIGSVEFSPMIDGRTMPSVIFSDVLHVPSLADNLLSVLNLTRRHGFNVMIERDRMCFRHSGRTVFMASVGASNVALLSGSVCSASANLASSASVASYDLLHRRLCHPGRDRLLKLVSRNLASDISVNKSTSLSDICKSCIAGKSHRLPFPLRSTHRTKALELVHSDLHGPIDTQTPQGHRYWITFTDDYTHYRVVYTLARKDQAFDAFKQFKAQAEKQTGQMVKALRDDKGGEYISNKWENFMREHGIA